MLKQKNAFTLAEVMVTLALIGILASIMLPVISKARPNKQKAMFKKAYYVAERMVYELVNDEDLYPATGDKVGFDNTGEVEYMNSSYGSKDDEGKQKSKFCELFARKVNTTSDSVSCTADSASFSNSPSFTTTDGIAWHMPYTDFSANNAGSSTQIIRVDVNGTTKPNCEYKDNTQASAEGVSACLNPDRFVIKIEPDGKMYVDGLKEKEYLSSNDSLR